MEERSLEQPGIDLDRKRLRAWRDPEPEAVPRLLRERGDERRDRAIQIHGLAPWNPLPQVRQEVPDTFLHTSPGVAGLADERGILPAGGQRLFQKREVSALDLQHRQELLGPLSGEERGPLQGGSLRSSVFDLARPSGVSVGADAPLRRSPAVTRVSETGASGARGGGASLAEESERALRTWCARAAARSLSCAVQLLGLRPSSKVTRPARSPSSLTGRTSTERIPSEAAHSSRTGAVPVGRWVSSTATAVTRSRASRKPAASS